MKCSGEPKLVELNLNASMIFAAVGMGRVWR